MNLNRPFTRHGKLTRPHTYGVAAVRIDRSRKANRAQDPCPPCERLESNAATPGLGTEPGAVVLIDTHYQSVFRHGRSWPRSLKATMFHPDCARQSRNCNPVSQYGNTSCLLQQHLADMVLYITRCRLFASYEQALLAEVMDTQAA